ncbi:MAG: S8 family serine peptidase [Candidatus Aenigmatarchaeota archaeon]
MAKLRETRDYSSSKRLYAAFLAIIVAFCGIWLASHSSGHESITGAATRRTASAGEALERVLVIPSNAAAAAEGKAALSENVQHELKDGSFTVDVPVSLKSALRKYGAVQTVPKLRIPQPAAAAFGGKPGRERACLPTVQLPWGVSKVGGGSGGKGINIAILDTGVAKHPDLRIAACADTTRRKVTGGCDDQNGHGTHVAGIVGANGGKDGKGIYGIAPDASIWAIKVCKADGTCWADDIAEGIYYAVDRGANIISMSIGADVDVGIIRDAIEYGARHGVLFVAAAGNDGPTDGSIDWPAAYAAVVAVGAVDSGDAVAGWSSRGINYETTPWVVEERDIEFAAPGVSIESTWKDGCYRTLSGTSMAAPHIAGLAAKLWQGSAAATRDYLRYIARYYYSDIGREGDDPDAGFGLPAAQAE